MPIRNKLILGPSIDEKELWRELRDEFVAPKQIGEPDIVIEEPDRIFAGGSLYGIETRLFVIWDKWENVEQERRGDIIQAAYYAAKGEVKAARVKVVKGFTRKEAIKIGYLEI